jgi:hypothetical protein
VNRRRVSCANGERGLAIDGTGDDGRAGGLGDLEGLPSEVGLVHDAVTFGDFAISRTDLMRIDDERVAHRDLGQSDIRDLRAGFAVRYGGHAFRQSCEHGGCAAQCVVLQGLSSGEHEHDNGACEVFAKQDRGDDGDTAKQI